MTEPRTAAGRALLDRDLCDWPEGVDITADVLAIEAEAAELAGGLDAERLHSAMLHHWSATMGNRLHVCVGSIGSCASDIADEYDRLSRQSVVIPAGQDETPRTGEHSS